MGGEFGVEGEDAETSCSVLHENALVRRTRKKQEGGA